MLPLNGLVTLLLLQGILVRDVWGWWRRRPRNVCIDLEPQGISRSVIYRLFLEFEFRERNAPGSEKFQTYVDSWCAKNLQQRLCGKMRSTMQGKGNQRSIRKNFDKRLQFNVLPTVS
jgi:hypothetical protein